MLPGAEFVQRAVGLHPPGFTPFGRASAPRSPRPPLVSLQNSLSEVTGSRSGHGKPGKNDNELLLNYRQGGEEIGERATVHARVRDESGYGVPNTLVEGWRPIASGRYRDPNDTYLRSIDPNFGGCAGTDFTTGPDWFQTVRIAKVEGWHARNMAPRFNFWLVARGINLGLQARVYCSDEEAAQVVDPVLNIIEQQHRRKTSIARRDERDGKTVYGFDIQVQG